MNGLLGCSTLMLLSANAVAPVDPALLKRLAEHATRLEALQSTAHVERMVAEELDSDKKVISTQESVWQVSVLAGHTQRRIIKAVKDGKDVTDERRKEREEREESERKSPSDGKSKRISVELESPFSASLQPRHRFTLVGEEPNHPSLLRIHFEPSGSPAEELSSGHATVDPASGELVRLLQRPSKNPSMVDRLQIEMELDAKTSAGRALSKLQIDGEGGFLFIRKRFRMTTLMSDYSEGHQSPSPPAP